jgi:acetoacetyl-CoA reductase/3-oxoacyl-[acyl-carrier protein] reductase
VSKYESVVHFLDLIKENLTDIVLINCAGISYNSFAHKSDPEKWKKVIDVNLIGTYHMIRALLPLMRDQNFGRIINFSSVIAQKGTPGVSAYAASKAGLWGMTRSLAQENGSKGITVNNINLGYVSLGMGVEQVPQSFQENIKNQIPSKRFCEPNDIYRTVKFLMNTSYVNGTSIDLNGGLY